MAAPSRIDWLERRVQSLEDENARLKQQIKSHQDGETSRRQINGRPAVTLAEAAALARISYQAAYRRVLGEIKTAPRWAYFKDSNRIIWVYTDQSLS